MTLIPFLTFFAWPQREKAGRWHLILRMVSSENRIPLFGTMRGAILRRVAVFQQARLWVALTV